MKKDHNLKEDAEQLLGELDDTYIDFVHNDYGNWEDIMDLIDRSRDIIYRFLHKNPRP